MKINQPANDLRFAGTLKSKQDEKAPLVAHLDSLKHLPILVLSTCHFTHCAVFAADEFRIRMNSHQAKVAFMRFFSLILLGQLIFPFPCFCVHLA